MILTVPLYPGTALANVRYKWLANGVEGPVLSSGITQPDTDLPIFRFDVIPPTGAEEMVAFDTTNAGNWNVAGYLGIPPVAAPPGPPIVISGLVPGVPGLRTTKFRSVYESVLRRHGLDPLVSTEHDVLRAVVEHINNRVETAWGYWEWPQLTLIQQRAFRTVWTPSLQFYRVNAEGVPDECYYEITQLYYRVMGNATTDPPVGTLPTNASFFKVVDVTNRYILMDQPNQTPIGEAIAVFDSDPRASQYHYASKIPFRPNEREISITWAGSGPTVWLFFKIPPSEFTVIPYMTGKNYLIGDTVFHTPDGECYQANQDSPTGPPGPIEGVTGEPTQWTKVPFPALFRRYVVAGAYADGLNETDPQENDPVKLQIRDTKLKIANDEAEGFIQQEVDGLVAQGQVYRYGEFNPVRWWRSHSRYW